MRFNFNKRFNVFPLAIISPTTNEEAAFVLSVFKQYNLDFSIRSGGHCYEPGSLSNCFILDLSNFNAIMPNVAAQEVYIGAGTRLGDVINVLGQINYAIPVGTCPTNCITGFTLGGGIGLLGRPYGLSCDSVISITLLTADAQVVEVSENSNPDLFWALRGGGNGSYGVVLGFKFKMYYIPVVSFYELSWEWNPKTFPQIFKTWQKWVKTLPQDISTILRLSYEEGKITFNIIGLKISDQPFTEWEKAFAHFNPTVTIKQESFLDSSKSWALQPDLPFNKGKSKIMMKPLNNTVIKKIVNYFEKLSNNNAKYLVLFDFEAFGGVIPQFNTSFFPRNAFGWWYQAIYWRCQDQTEEGLKYSRRFYSSVSSEVSPYSYANTVDYDLGKHYLKAYYGDKVNCLIRVKNKVDPTNFFRWKQSIPLEKHQILDCPSCPVAR